MIPYIEYFSNIIVGAGCIAIAVTIMLILFTLAKWTVLFLVKEELDSQIYECKRELRSQINKEFRDLHERNAILAKRLMDLQEDYMKRWGK